MRGEGEGGAFDTGSSPGSSSQASPRGGASRARGHSEAGITSAALALSSTRSARTMSEMQRPPAQSETKLRASRSFRARMATAEQQQEHPLEGGPSGGWTLSSGRSRRPSDSGGHSESGSARTGGDLMAQVLSLRKENKSIAHQAEQEIDALQARLREVSKVREAEGNALRQENEELTARAQKAEEHASELETEMENLRFEVDYEREERDRAMLVLEDGIKGAQADAAQSKSDLAEAEQRALQAEDKAEHLRELLRQGETDAEAVAEQLRAKVDGLSRELRQARAAGEAGRREADDLREQLQQQMALLKETTAQFSKDLSTAEAKARETLREVMQRAQAEAAEAARRLDKAQRQAAEEQGALQEELRNVQRHADLENEGFKRRLADIEAQRDANARSIAELQQEKHQVELELISVRREYECCQETCKSEREKSTKAQRSFEKQMAAAAEEASQHAREASEEAEAAVARLKEQLAAKGAELSEAGKDAEAVARHHAKEKAKLEEDITHAKEGTRAVERSRVELEERLACLSDKLGRCQRAATEDLQAAQAQHDAKVEKIMKEVNQIKQRMEAAIQEADREIQRAYAAAKQSESEGRAAAGRHSGEVKKLTDAIHAAKNQAHEAGLRATAAQAEAKALSSAAAEQRSALVACQNERRALEVQTVELGAQVEAATRQLAEERATAEERLRVVEDAREADRQKWATKLAEAEAAKAEATALMKDVESRLLSDLRAKESEFGSLEASSRKEAEALQAKLDEAWRGRSEAESGLVEARAALNESQGLAGREAAALAAEVTRLREVATAEGKAAAGQIANLRSELTAAEEDRRRVEHSLQTKIEKLTAKAAEERTAFEAAGRSHRAEAERMSNDLIDARTRLGERERECASLRTGLKSREEAAGREGEELRSEMAKLKAWVRQKDSEAEEAGKEHNRELEAAKVELAAASEKVKELQSDAEAKRTRHQACVLQLEAQVKHARESMEAERKSAKAEAARLEQLLSQMEQRAKNEWETKVSSLQEAIRSLEKRAADEQAAAAASAEEHLTRRLAEAAAELDEARRTAAESSRRAARELETVKAAAAEERRAIQTRSDAAVEAAREAAESEAAELRASAESTVAEGRVAAEAAVAEAERRAAALVASARRDAEVGRETLEKRLRDAESSSQTALAQAGEELAAARKAHAAAMDEAASDWKKQVDEARAAEGRKIARMKEEAAALSNELARVKRKATETASRLTEERQTECGTLQQALSKSRAEVHDLAAELSRHKAVQMEVERAHEAEVAGLMEKVHTATQALNESVSEVGTLKAQSRASADAAAREMSLLRKTLDEARATHRKEADVARAELFESQRNAKQAEEVAQRQISELLRAAENAQKTMQASAASHHTNCDELVAKIVAAQDAAHDAKARATLLESQKSSVEVQLCNMKTIWEEEKASMEGKMAATGAEAKAAIKQLHKDASEAGIRHAGEVDALKAQLAELENRLESQREAHDRAYEALAAQARRGADALNQARCQAARLTSEKTAAESQLEQMQAAMESRAKQAEERALEVSTQASNAICTLEGHLKAAERRGRERAAELEAEVEALRSERGRMRELHANSSAQMEQDLGTARKALRKSKTAAEGLEHKLKTLSKAKRELEVELSQRSGCAVEAEKSLASRAARSREIRLAALSAHPRARLLAAAFRAWQECEGQKRDALDAVNRYHAYHRRASKRRVMAAWLAAVGARREEEREMAQHELQVLADSARSEVERLSSMVAGMEARRTAASNNHVQELKSLQDKLATLSGKAAELETTVARLQAERDHLASQLKRAEVASTADLESTAARYKAETESAMKTAAARLAASQKAERDMRDHADGLEAKTQSLQLEIQSLKQRHEEEVQSLRKRVNEQRGLRSSAEKGRSEVDTQLRQEAAVRQSEVSELNERMEMFKSRLAEILERVQLERSTLEAEYDETVAQLRRELQKTRTDANETISVRDAELRLREQTIERLTSERDLALTAARNDNQYEYRVGGSARRKAMHDRIRKAESDLAEQIEYLEGSWERSIEIEHVVDGSLD